jgi:transcriptional regulator with XRE-family HTH domain
MWPGIGGLLRQWREDVLAEPLRIAAARANVSAATLSDWETAKVRISNEKIRLLDTAYGAGNALADLAWSLNTPLGLPPDEAYGISPRRYWAHTFVATEHNPPPGGPVWAWIRPGPERPDRVQARLWWGPVGLHVDEPCGPAGVFVSCPVSVPHPPVCARMEIPGWIDFGRGVLPTQLKVTEIQAREHMEIYGYSDWSTAIFTALLHRMLGTQGLTERLIKFARSERPDLIRSLTDRFAPKLEWQDLTDRAKYPAGEDYKPVFDPTNCTALRLARNMTQRELARIAEMLPPFSSIDHRVINRFEKGTALLEVGVRPRLDSALGADGYTGWESVPVEEQGREEALVSFPRYWVGPVTVCVKSPTTANSRGRIELLWGRWRSWIVIEDGTIVTMERCSPDDEPLLIRHEPGWTVLAGIGYEPRAVNINSTWRSKNRQAAEAVAAEARSGYLRLFNRSDAEFDELRRSGAVEGPYS